MRGVPSRAPTRRGTTIPSPHCATPSCSGPAESVARRADPRVKRRPPGKKPPIEASEVGDMGGEQELQDRPLGELVQQASQQTAKLVRQEIRLAQVELQEKGKRAGIGIGAFGSAGVIATY